MDYFLGKVIFLTGASSGIGEALALECARRGAIVGLFARREELLNELQLQIESAGGAAKVFVGDVTDEEIVFDAAEQLRAEFGKIDILIANAGIAGGNTDARTYVPQAVKKVIDVNLMGAINAVGAVLPEMINHNQGQIVAISSLAGFRGLPRSGAYSASKAAMTNYFESLRLDVRDKDISVTIIQPGFIKTPLTAARENRMPFLMELCDALPHFMNAIERKKCFAAFPWQLATVVRVARCFPCRLYDRIAGGVKYRE
ncbi:MAG: SDR family NAD(P)-dependent oxidoreductase [Pyrinomonadaceae bacterium]